MKDAMLFWLAKEAVSFLAFVAVMVVVVVFIRVLIYITTPRGK